ncbi:DUF4345 domain-containing protein [Tenacibaculum sp. nBUS_03]|uniref:DUF4345 domain-containing protein n=1 Tax=Tenacibaculum sp. nBUS_03 TaxID=3395320 RepID=UPI003EB6BC74
MDYKTILLLKNLHLIISLLIVVPTAIIYGTPSILSTNLNIEVTSIDLSNLLKAIMCLYIGVSCIWLLGIIKEKYWKSATQLNILFMLTLASGRMLSLVIDGIPTKGYVFGVIAELVIGLFSVYQLRKYSN